MDDVDDARAEFPATSLYRQLVADHTDRVYGYVMLLVGDRSVSENIANDSFRRTSQALLRGQIMGDAEEVLYRHATREGLRRLARSKELRGQLPPTSADDRQITAFGIIDGFSPQQRAAIFLAAWGQLGYRVAGVATGIGEGRAAELAFAARQEYREARGYPSDMTPACQDAGPVLSARADGARLAGENAVDDHLVSCDLCRGTAAAFDEFGAVVRAIHIPSPTTDVAGAALGEVEAHARRRVAGIGDILRLAVGPGLLVVVLIVGLLVFQQCSEASVQTGLGRTSDLLYVHLRDESGDWIVTLDSGSGRELSRVPGGTLTGNGQRVYSAEASCEGGPCVTTIRLSDTGTTERTDVAQVDGRLEAVAVVEERQDLYLVDAASGWTRLLRFDLEVGRLSGSVSAPTDLLEPYRPGRTALAEDGSVLFGVASSVDDESGRVLATDLRAMEIIGSVPLERAELSSVNVLPRTLNGRAYAYEPGGGRLHEVSIDGAQSVASIDMETVRSTAATGGTTSVVEGALAAGAQGLLYAVHPSGGIAVVEADPLRVVRQVREDRRYTAVVVSSDGEKLYALEEGGTYVVLDEATGMELLRRNQGQIVGFVQVNAGQ
ncbi:MAG: hypothetical protein GEU73_14685 [Chloroflexi bacterium]|nr:hypothetical protein [Chloroflexota bacterium]